MTHPVVFVDKLAANDAQSSVLATAVEHLKAQEGGGEIVTPLDKLKQTFPKKKRPATLLMDTFLSVERANWRGTVEQDSKIIG